MRIYFRIMVFLGAFLISFTALAQEKGKHTVKPKETLYSISREYNVSVEALKAANPILVEGLKTGQVIVIPNAAASTGNPFAAAMKSEKTVSHIVLAGETKFGISKKYGLTVAQLEKQNQGIEQNLPVGYKLAITPAAGSAKTDAPKPVVVEKPKPTITQVLTPNNDHTEIIRTTKKTAYANYEVKPKETLFSLTQMFGITESELVTLNPNLKDGLKIGMILKVPGKGSIVVEDVKPTADLAKTIFDKDKKHMVLLLPFNASKIQGDSLKSISSRLKTESFLNMTLDFYAGAMMAIDSAKVLGLNIDVQILDSEENKMSSNVTNIVQNFDLKKADVVVGPFYQQYAEKVAELLHADGVPVISPLSKEAGKGYSNLYQSMPSSEYTKRAMLDYMMAKNGNIIIVADPKRGANKEFITQNYPSAAFADLDDNGNLNPDKLKAMFVTDRVNYVVLDSEKTGMILSTTNVLLNEMANFQLQLAIIEPNETLDFEEISMKRLTILKLLYPSLTRENNSPEAQAFANDFKNKNKIFPSQYAIRGFDVTFDTMLRLSQGKTFEQSVADTKTEQVESKFDYMKKDSEGYVNKGIYILQYEEDLSVKQAN